MRLGFSLIELVIALAIAGIMGSSLFIVYSQLGSVVSDVETMISSDVRVATLDTQLCRDINGAFVPQAALEQPVKDKKEQKKPLDRVFVADHGDQGMFKELTCITCNPLYVYGQYTPRAARVIYTLKKSENYTNAWSLWRQESLNLLYEETQKKARSYQVIDNIKQMSVKYYTLDPEKKDSPTPVYSERLVWRSEQEKKEEAPIKKGAPPQEKPPRLPDFVFVQLVLWLGNKQEEEQTFELWYVVYADEPEAEQKPEPKPEPKPDNNKSRKLSDIIGIKREK